MRPRPSITLACSHGRHIDQRSGNSFRTLRPAANRYEVRWINALGLDDLLDRLYSFALGAIIVQCSFTHRGHHHVQWSSSSFAMRLHSTPSA
jgi:hypothetical protein